jgi:hypothetical protein
MDSASNDWGSFLDSTYAIQNPISLNNVVRNLTEVTPSIPLIKILRDRDGG